MVWGKVETIDNNNWISISCLTTKLFPERKKAKVTELGQYMEKCNHFEWGRP